MKKIKRWRVYQTISILVDAENKEDAKNRALSDESNFDGWNKWTSKTKWAVELDCQYVNTKELKV